jgi:S-DNA-T family DNA segregation ATPase FtsK/SpoIIIE
VRFDEATALSQLLVALGLEADERVFAAGSLLQPTTPLARAVADGAVISIGIPETPPAAVDEHRGTLELRIVGGPCSGLRFALPEGRWTIGRSQSTEVQISIPDEAVSSVHCSVTVANGKVTLGDLGSRNGTVLEGDRCTVPASVEVGDAFQIGSTIVELARRSSPDASPVDNGDGSFTHTRTFPATPTALELRVEFPRVPDAHDAPSPWSNAGLMLVMPLAMLAGSLALGGTRNLLTFIPLVLGSVAVAGYGGVTRRRSQHRQRARETGRFAEEAQRAASRLTELGRAERRRRRLDAFDTPRVLATALGPRRELWQRRPGLERFLTVRVGLATQLSRIAVTNAPGAAPIMAWMVPVEVDLATAGTVALIGDAGPVRALATNVVTQLVTLHGPDEVKIVVLTETTEETAWSWCGWLPHARWGDDEEFVLFGNDPLSVRQRLGELTALLDSRREQAERDPQARFGPAVVVVYDDATRWTSLGFGDIVRDGPRFGIYGIALDATRGPEGVGAKVVAGTSGDDGVVEIAGTPVLSDVILDGFWAGFAEPLARGLARLRPGTTGGAAELPGSVRLLDLLALGEAVEAAAVEAEWASGGRSPAGVVGLGTSGPVAVNLKNDGPHGVIAGTTRSGKSEFIKTLIASLAVANTPENLHFLIIDFKEGNDYLVARELPHTVDLVTNADLDDFVRAVRLLDAELSRRRQVMQPARVANIEAYWSARDGDPTIGPPIGRLLVIVDEFAELVTDDRGREQLGRLVSVARTGAASGVHLLLAAQDPSGVVTGQIDANTALRVCFRVQDVGQSREMIGVPDAGRIAPRHAGRGYKQTRPDSPVAFQSARVAGRRRGLAEAGLVTVTEMFWDRIGHVPQQPQTPEVPDPETDFWDLAAAIRSAAERIGQTRAPVPWPKPLPAVVTLAELPAPAEGSVAIGLIDEPDRQSHTALEYSLGGDHLAIGGSQGTGRTTALRTIITALTERYTAVEMHLYLIDFAGGGLRPFANLPHTAGLADGDAEQATRLVEEIATIANDRRQRLNSAGATDLAEYQRASGGVAIPHVVVAVDGWEALVEDTQRTSLTDDLANLLGRTLSVGVQAVVAGDATVAKGRVGRVFGRKLALEFVNDVDYSLFNIAPRHVPASMPPGRALDGKAATQVQFAVLAGAGGAEESAAVRQHVASVTERDAAVGGRPRRIEPLPDRIALSQVLDQAPRPSGAVPVLVGLAGTSVEPRWVDLGALGGAFFVGGPRQSGKSTALLSMATSTAADDRQVVIVAPPRSPLATWAEGQALSVFGLEDTATAVESLAPGALLVVDDADRMVHPSEPLLALMANPGPAVGVLIAAGIEPLVDQAIGLLGLAKRSRAGVLLWPRTKFDGGVFGTQLPEALVGRAGPGRGVLGYEGQLEMVQVADPTV